MRRLTAARVPTAEWALAGAKRARIRTPMSALLGRAQREDGALRRRAGADRHRRRADAAVDVEQRLPDAVEAGEIAVAEARRDLLRQAADLDVPAVGVAGEDEPGAVLGGAVGEVGHMGEHDAAAVFAHAGERALVIGVAGDGVVDGDDAERR